MIRMLFIGIALVVVTSFVQAQATDPSKVQQIATQICSACHGNDGNSTSPANPHLAGQHADYIAKQLKHFRDGIRVNAIMAPMVANLKNDSDLKLLGQYYAQQKIKPATAKNKALAERGQKLYRGGNSATSVPACAGCHAPNGVGIPSQYPRLAGQFADYTYAQLKAFKNGERGADEQKDANGKIMAAIAIKLSDREMQEVAEYIAGLR